MWHELTRHEMTAKDWILTWKRWEREVNLKWLEEKDIRLLKRRNDAAGTVTKNGNASKFQEEQEVLTRVCSRRQKLLKSSWKSYKSWYHVKRELNDLRPCLDMIWNHIDLKLKFCLHMHFGFLKLYFFS